MEIPVLSDELAEKMGQCSGAKVRNICTEAGEFSPMHICSLAIAI